MTAPDYIRNLERLQGKTLMSLERTLRCSLVTVAIIGLATGRLSPPLASRLGITIDRFGLALHAPRKVTISQVRRTLIEAKNEQAPHDRRGSRGT